MWWSRGHRRRWTGAVHGREDRAASELPWARDTRHFRLPPPYVELFTATSRSPGVPACAVGTGALPALAGDVHPERSPVLGGAGQVIQRNAIGLRLSGMRDSMAACTSSGANMLINMISAPSAPAHESSTLPKLRSLPITV